VPVSVWILTAFFAAGQFVLAKTVYGRMLFAIGGNNEASRLAGLPTEWLRTSTYVVSGGCASVAGMIIASRLAIGQADIGGTMALDAIAIVVIGGTSLLGGEGAAWRTVIGMLIVAVLTNLLDSLAIDANYQLLIKGVIVIAAVALDARVRAAR
jgi:ribose transport system permease protein